MKAIKFLIQDVTNPDTGEELERLAVEFDNGKVMKFYPGQDETIESFKASVTPENRASVLERVIVVTGQFGDYCRLTNARTKDSF